MPKKPDLFEDPDGHINWRLREVREEYERRREYHSRSEAMAVHGEKQVRKAYKWLRQGIKKQDPKVLKLYEAVMSSANPYETLVMNYTMTKMKEKVLALPSKKDVGVVVRLPSSLGRK